MRREIRFGNFKIRVCFEKIKFKMNMFAEDER